MFSGSRVYRFIVIVGLLCSFWQRVLASARSRRYIGFTSIPSINVRLFEESSEHPQGVAVTSPRRAFRMLLLSFSPQRSIAYPTFCADILQQSAQKTSPQIHMSTNSDSKPNDANRLERLRLQAEQARLEARKAELQAEKLDLEAQWIKLEALGTQPDANLPSENEDQKRDPDND